MEHIYERNSKGGFTFKGIVLGEGETSSKLIIPDVYKGLPVSDISISADYFSPDINLFTDIVIGNNVVTITDTTALFFRGENLERIYLGKSVRNCINLLNVSSNKIGGIVTDIYIHKDCSFAPSTTNSAGSIITHHRGILDIKYQVVGDYINKTPISLIGCDGKNSSGEFNGEIPDGSITPEKLDREYATPEFVEDEIDKIAVSGGQVQADCSETDESKASFIKNKPEVDEEVTEDSENLITSGAVFDAIQNIENPEGLATEKYVDENIEKSLDFKEIELSEDFEEYTDVIHLSEPVQKDWSKVKIWSADDGLTAESTDPLVFDFSQILETNYAEVGKLPETIDFSLYDGQEIVVQLLFYDDVAKTYFQILFLQNSTIGTVFNFAYYKEGMTHSPSFSYIKDSGWNISSAEMEENLSVVAGTYTALKLVDFVSFFVDDSSLLPDGFTPENVNYSIDTLLNLFLKDMITISYPSGYYVADKTEKYATKEDVNTMLDSFAAMLDAANREVI